jgi:hypothetical protein
MLSSLAIEMSKDRDYYLRLSQTVADPELAGYYLEKAGEAQLAGKREDIESLTKSYVLALRQLGVTLPERVSVEVRQAS